MDSKGGFRKQSGGLFSRRGRVPMFLTASRREVGKNIFINSDSSSLLGGVLFGFMREMGLEEGDRPNGEGKSVRGTLF